jgi:hypothetical protein
VCCDQRDCDFSTGQAHREIFDPAALGEKFGLPWELETGVVHPGFVNRTGYYRIELATPGECDRFFKGSGGGTRRFRGGMSRRTGRIFADDFVLRGFRDPTRFQCRINNLRPDSGAIAQRDPDSRFHRAHAPARDRNRICSIEHEQD